MKYAILPLFLLACSGDPDVGQKNECNIPERYTATYTKLNGECGTFETETFPSELEPSWFPLALNLEDCEQSISCVDGVIQGSSFCMRTTQTAFGTLDSTLTFDTQTNSGTLELEITATDYHRTSSCNSTYQVTYE